MTREQFLESWVELASAGIGLARLALSGSEPGAGAITAQNRLDKLCDDLDALERRARNERRG